MHINSQKLPLILVVLLSVEASLPQCIQQSATTSGFAGRVFSVWGTPPHEMPLKGVKVTLVKRTNRKPVVERTTDEDGLFAAKVRPGNYFITATIPGLEDLSADIEILRPSGTNPTTLAIRLSPPSARVDSCDSEITVKKK